MKKTVWRYPLKPTVEQTISVPIGACLLTVATKSDNPQLWFLVDPSQKKEKRTFFIVGTGTEFDETQLRYIGTFLNDNDMYVFHVFERLSVLQRDFMSDVWTII